MYRDDDDVPAPAPSVQAIARDTCTALEISNPESLPGSVVSNDDAAVATETLCTNVSTLGRHGRSITCAVFHEEGHVVASCSDDRTVKLWQPSEIEAGCWTNSVTLHGHLETVHGVSFSPKGLPLMLASCSRDGTVRLWVPETLKDEGSAYKWVCGQVRRPGTLNPTP